MIFNLITYTFLDFLIGSTLVAIVLTYIIDHIYAYFRQWLGRRNIASKVIKILDNIKGYDTRDIFELNYINKYYYFIFKVYRKYHLLTKEFN